MSNYPDHYTLDRETPHKREDMDPEDVVAVNLAIGRLFRIMSRPFREGDHEQYERCRSVVLNLVEPREEYRVCWPRDRLKGAQGD